MTDKLKGFRSKSSQSSHIRKLSRAPYRYIDHYVAQRGRSTVGRFTQRQHEVMDLQSVGDLGPGLELVNISNDPGEVITFLSLFCLYK